MQTSVVVVKLQKQTKSCNNILRV